jgi:hypothetical protein
MNETDDLDQRLQLARLGLASTADARARVRDGLVARGAFSAARSAPSACAPARVGTLATSKRGGALVISVALMGASFAGGYLLRDVREGEAARATSSVVEPTRAAPPEAALPEAAPPEAASPAPSAASPTPQPPRALAPEPLKQPERAPPRARPERSDPLRATVAARRATRSSSPSTSDAAPPSSELSRLRRAERAIRSGDPALALLLLDQLDRAYPTSALGEERAAARILVECARSGELGKPEAKRFLEQHRSSVYFDRIVRACRLEDPMPTESAADVGAGGH